MMRPLIFALLSLAPVLPALAAEAPAATNAAGPGVLTLESAMGLAAENNAEIAIQQAAVEQSREQGSVAGSRLLPQVSGNARYTQIDEDRSGARGSGAAERDMRVGLALSQSIYDEAARASVGVSRRATRQAMHEEQRARLDAMHEAGTGFLQFLLARSLRDIAADNLKLTLEHLTLARNRHKLGAAGLDEVLRFEAEEARQRGNLLAAESVIEKARIALNRAMGEDAGETWSVQPIQLAEGSYYFLDDAKLGSFLSAGEARVAQFREFSVIKALDGAPELKGLGEAIAAQRLVISQKQRSYYIPQISANAGFDRILEQHYAGSSDASAQFAAAGLAVSEPDDNEWQAAVVARLPLFESGARRHDIAADQAQLDQIEQTRVKIAQQIEQRALAAVYDLASTHARISHARTAADRARRSQEIVNEKYKRGAAQIIEVLDAQNEALREDIAAVNTLIEYLRNVVEYQRAIAWFEKFQSPEARAAWINHFNRFIAQPAGEKPADRPEAPEGAAPAP